MNRKGEWRLSPAFDVSYAYNPDGSWTQQHQMSFAEQAGVAETTAQAIHGAMRREIVSPG